MAVVAFALIAAVYILVWRGNVGDLLVVLFQRILNLEREEAFWLYNSLFRYNFDLFFFGAVVVTFFTLLGLFLKRFTQYFDMINEGINALLDDKGTEIVLVPEMIAIEQKLNTVRQTLEKRAAQAQEAEQRKNDLIMYLAHDIRTPLTSVIGYLNLLDESPEMSVEQRTKYLHTTLDKAYRLETLINEFFEVTHFNSRQINREKIDLYYMLVQVADEMYPSLSARGITTKLCADESLTVCGDSVMLARVFNNILKNAAAYSDSNTEILISAEEKADAVSISFQNKGKTIPAEKLSHLFDKFYRLDDARASETGGSGLGLSIAKEIVEMHNGTISAQSVNDTVAFTVLLPVVT
jgi:two-component system sensor histidine kinase VanS